MENVTNNRPKLDRVTVDTFVDHQSRIAVRITKLPLSPWPQYSLIIGTFMEDGRVMPFVQIRRDPSLASLVFEHDYEVIIGRLTRSASEALAMYMQADIKTYVDARYDKDLARANFGKPATKHTGKTEKNRGKKA